MCAPSFLSLLQKLLAEPIRDLDHFAGVVEELHNDKEVTALRERPAVYMITTNNDTNYDHWHMFRLGDLISVDDYTILKGLILTVNETPVAVH